MCNSQGACTITGTASDTFWKQHDAKNIDSGCDKATIWAIQLNSRPLLISKEMASIINHLWNSLRSNACKRASKARAETAQTGPQNQTIQPNSMIAPGGSQKQTNEFWGVWKNNVPEIRTVENTIPRHSFTKTWFSAKIFTGHFLIFDLTAVSI